MMEVNMTMFLSRSVDLRLSRERERERQTAFWYSGAEVQLSLSQQKRVSVLWLAVESV